jgi:RNA polymerase sigma-B factor
MRPPRSVGTPGVETPGRHADPLPDSGVDVEALADVPEAVALPSEGAAAIRADLERLQRLRPDDPERLRLRQHVVESHLPLVRVLANRYRDLGEPLDDLVQVGTIGLIHAVDRFDPGRGTGLASYATPNILGEIRRHFRDRAWAVRVPRRLQELQARTSAAREDLAQRLGRSPTVTELAQALGLEEEAVLEGLEARRAYAAVPLDRPDGQPEMDGALVTVDSALDEVVDRESLRPVLRGLPARDKRILALRYFRGLSQAQIAEELGISQMHVSRLLARTLGRLNDCLIEGGEAAADVGSRPGRPGTAPGSPAGSSAGSAPAAAAGAGRTARPPQPRRAPASERRADPVRSDSLRAGPCRTGARAVRRAG